MDKISPDIVHSWPALPSRLVHWWLQVPPNLSARERWYYGAALVAHPASLLGHGGSVAVWVAMAALLRRRKLALNFFILAAETACHAVLATLFLGWSSGAQYYLILVAIATVLAPIASWIMAAYITGAAGTFFALYLWTAYHAQWASVGIRQLTIGEAFCVAHVFTIAALIVGYVVGIATRTEAALQDAHERSERLLSNVLPQTMLCATAPPARVVDMLDTLFSAFDLLVSPAQITPRLSPISPSRCWRPLATTMTRKAPGSACVSGFTGSGHCGGHREEPFSLRSLGRQRQHCRTVGNV